MSIASCGSSASTTSSTSWIAALRIWVRLKLMPAPGAGQAGTVCRHEPSWSLRRAYGSSVRRGGEASGSDEQDEGEQQRDREVADTRRGVVVRVLLHERHEHGRDRRAGDRAEAADHDDDQ